MTERRPKHRFLAFDKPENHNNEEEKEKTSRESGERKEEKEKRATVPLLIFVYWLVWR